MQDPDTLSDDDRRRNDPPPSFGGEMSVPLTILNVVLLAILVLGAVGFVWLMSSLPRIEGRVPIKGLELPAQVGRDASGIPHIKARSTHDAYFVLGWIHAQDRLWQMELQRRVGSGRLAEVIGQAGLGNDRFMRTLGLYRLAQATFPRLDRGTQDALLSYTEGVNAWMRDHRYRLPLEYRLLRFSPEPWTPADSLVWGRLMALQLTNDWPDEALRAKMAGLLDSQALKDLWPERTDQPTILGAAAADGLLANLPDAAKPHQASNVWVVDGNHSASGKPLLANDPHLGFRSPILWYLANLEAPGLSLAGATVPGVPFHLIGHNARIAWGITSSYVDTTDLFLEKRTGQDSYLTPDGPRPLDTREEQIAVKDGDSVTLTIRTTRHGPVISDLPGMADGLAPDQLLAFRSTALEADDRTADALFQLNRAPDWAGFKTALAKVSAPSQNFAYADTAGAIGFITAGKAPIRAGGDGGTPVEGWTGRGDWIAWAPAEQMPTSFKPADGFIVNANNRLVAGPRGTSLASTWPESYRAERITSLLTGRKDLTMADMANIQADHLSLEAVEIKALFGIPANLPAQAMRAAQMIAEWDGKASRDRPEPLIFAAWQQQVWHDLLADDLGDGFSQFSRVRPYVLANILRQDDRWCDDRGTPAVESCADIVAASLVKAVTALTGRHGENMHDWRWGDEHQAEFRNPVLSQIPLIGGRLGVSIATDGDDFTVNRGTYRSEDFRHVHGAGLRAIYDLADLNNSRFMIATGQSGNPLSRHNRDLIGPWRDNKSVSLGATEKMEAILRLEPGY